MKAQAWYAKFNIFCKKEEKSQGKIRCKSFKLNIPVNFLNNCVQFDEHSQWLHFDSFSHRFSS